MDRNDNGTDRNETEWTGMTPEQPGKTPEWTRMDWNEPKWAGMRWNDTGIDQRSYRISRNIPFTLSSFFYLKIHAWNLSELLSKIKERKMFNKHSVHLIIITLINVWKTKQLTVMHQVLNSEKTRTHAATFCTTLLTLQSSSDIFNYLAKMAKVAGSSSQDE